MQSPSLQPSRSAASAATTTAATSAQDQPAAAPSTAASGLGGFGHSIVQEVDNATAKWMKMISSTFLGETSASSTLFSRKQLESTPLSKSKRPLSKHQVDPTPMYKIALVGGAGVGKTSIVRRWLQRSYPSAYVPTIGVDVSTLRFQQEEQEDVLIQIYDVASAEVDSKPIHSLLCEDLDGIFFVFNVHRVSSIAAIDKWRHALAPFISCKEIPSFLVSHKADLIQKRVMASDDIEAYAQAAGYKAWIWTVGKSSFGENDKQPAVMQALERMIKCIRPQRRPGTMEKHDGSTPLPLEIVKTDDALHQFASGFLRLPTQTITTLPRHEQEEDTKKYARDFGGNWLLGNDKGMYLRVTDDSVLADAADETEEEEEENEEAEEVQEDEEEEQEEEEGEEVETKDEGDAEQGVVEDDEKVKDEDEATEKGEQVEEQRTSDEGNEAEARKPIVKEENDQEPPPVEPPAAETPENDEDAWRFFAGSISRTQAEDILSGREAGTFLLRRKDAQTLILSYVGTTSDQMHHALIEYVNQRYHVGSSKTATSSFPTLTKCLRSVRKYAFRGLVFTRHRAVQGTIASSSLQLETNADEHTRVNARALNHPIWRTRTQSDQSTSSMSTSPKVRTSNGLQAPQQHVHVPAKATRMEALVADFYNQLEARLTHLPADQATMLLDMVKQEKAEWKRSKRSHRDVEAQWRELVHQMDAWNRIVMNLVRRFLPV